MRQQLSRHGLVAVRRKYDWQRRPVLRLTATQGIADGYVPGFSARKKTRT